MVDIGEGYVRIYDDLGIEIIGWEEGEWIENPALAKSIAMAVKIYYEKGEEGLANILRFWELSSGKIIQVTSEQSSKIIESRRPFGLFYIKENNLFIGIDNNDGDAWVEEFKTPYSCFKWLKGERARDAHGQWLSGR